MPCHCFYETANFLSLEQPSSILAARVNANGDLGRRGTCPRCETWTARVTFLGPVTRGSGIPFAWG